MEAFRSVGKGASAHEAAAAHGGACPLPLALVFHASKASMTVSPALELYEGD